MKKNTKKILKILLIVQNTTPEPKKKEIKVNSRKKETKKNTKKNNKKFTYRPNTCRNLKKKEIKVNNRIQIHAGTYYPIWEYPICIRTICKIEYWLNCIILLIQVKYFLNKPNLSLIVIRPNFLILTSALNVFVKVEKINA